MSDLHPSSAETPSSSISTGDFELTELKRLCADLSSQAHNMRIAVLVLSTVMLGFFIRESRYNGHLAERTQSQAAQISKFDQSLAKQGTSMEKEIEKQNQAMQNFVGGLVEYGKTHPDFVPVLTKHGIPIAPPAAPEATGPVAPALGSSKK